MRLKEIRKANHVSRQDLADAIGVDVSVISKYESGKLTPPLKRLESIAYVLGVAPGDLLTVETNPTHHNDQTTRICSYASKFNKDSHFYLTKLVLLKANGHCELCKHPAPFLDKKGQPYLEIHRISANYNGDEPEKNLIALCPNCNAKMIHNPSEEDLLNIRKIAESHSF